LACDEANGRHRANVKRAKAEGLPVEAITESIAWARQDPETRRQRLISRIRVEGIRYPENGAALSEMLPNLDIRVSDRMRYTDTLFDGEQKGYQAGLGGAAADGNPYPPGSEMAQQWRNGWGRGNEVRSATVGTEGGRVGNAARRVPGRKRAAQPSMLPEESPEPRRPRGRPKGSKNKAGPNYRKAAAKKRGRAKRAARKMSNVAQFPSPGEAAE
jgi:ribosome modulation factor